MPQKKTIEKAWRALLIKVHSKTQKNQKKLQKHIPTYNKSSFKTKPLTKRLFFIHFNIKKHSTI